MPVPSPGKYIVRKVIADSSVAPIAKSLPQRSVTLGSAGRSNTVVDKLQLPVPLGLVKPKTLDIKASKSRRLLKSQSKKMAATYSMYDESFIRYVNELDSYFKASEIRHQSSKDAQEPPFPAHMTFPGAELRAVGALHNGLSGHRPGIPHISLSSARNDSEDVASSGSDSVSFCTTADWSSLMTGTPDYDSLSFFLTPSQGTTPEMSCYLTAEQNTSSETDTCIYKLPEEYGSQETLFNADSDYEDGSFRSVSNCDWQRSQDTAGLEDGFSQLNIGFRVRENVLSNNCGPRSLPSRIEEEEAGAVESAEEVASNSKLEAKVRRSNFVRTSCIDLEDELKSDPDNATVVTLQDEEKKKESYFKCCPV